MAERRCFILGAGFSCCCGFPAARRLTAGVWKTRACREPTDESSGPSLLQPGDFGFDAASRDYEAIRLLFPDKTCDPSDDATWPDFEPLITLLDEAHRYQGALERFLKQESSAGTGAVKEQLLSALEEWFGKLTDNIPERGIETIKKFIGQVDPDRDTIISFNWDTLVEIAAAEMQIPVRYRDDAGPGLKVAKPHGSLNLVDSPKDEYDEAQRSNSNYKRCIELSYGDNPTRVIVRAEDPRQAWATQIWAEARLIVEPNIRKQYDSFWLEHQWCRALQMVRSADVLVVIGFSLPDADIRPRLLLQLSRLYRAEPPRIQIVAPKAADLCDHYNRLTGLNPDPFPGTLEDWLRKAP